MVAAMAVGTNYKMLIIAECVEPAKRAHSCRTIVPADPWHHRHFGCLYLFLILIRRNVGDAKAGFAAIIVKGRCCN